MDALFSAQIAFGQTRADTSAVVLPLETRVVYRLSGTLRLTINFDMAPLGGEGHLIGTNEATGQTVDLGTYPIQGQLPQPGDASSIVGSSAGGTIQAKLTGPAAEELEATWEPMVPDPSNSSYFLKVMAVAAAKK